MKSLLLDAANRAAQYITALPTRRVWPLPSELESLSRFERPLQDEPVDPAEVLRELDETGSPATVGSAGGRYFGFVVGGSLPAAMRISISSWATTERDVDLSLEAILRIAADTARVSP